MRVLSLSAIVLVFFLVGCSGKVQTNKIPNEVKWNLPSQTQKYNNNVSSKYLVDFEEYAADFFSQSIGTNRALNSNLNKKDSGDELDIYSIGLKRGHFNEKD